MFLSFFLQLKAADLPVSLREYLAMLEAIKAGLADDNVEAFYFLARTTLVKDERFIDRFDQVFAAAFKGMETLAQDTPENRPRDLPEEWLRKLAQKHLTDDEKKLVEALGGFEKLMETLQQRLNEQKERHQGGSRWIGTAGTSPFGAHGYNPEGVRIGQHESRHRRATKVWDRRDFQNLDETVEIGTRNIKVALKRLRHWVRDGAQEEFDLDGTIHSTAEHGYLDIRMRPQRRNSVKLLIFFDIGGSMDDHVSVVEELFSALRGEFRHLDYFYFHNCIYESVWTDNSRRHAERIATVDLLNKYGPDYKVIIVGDAAMSPYEITHPGGSVEHWNAEAGGIWLQRVAERWKHSVWINPVRQDAWPYSQSTQLVDRIVGSRMFPLTLQGLADATRALSGIAALPKRAEQTL